MRTKCIHCARQVRVTKTKPLCPECGYFAVMVPDFDLNQEAESIKRQSGLCSRKRRCRDCGKKLPLSRYYRCFNCDEPFLRNTESEWDSFSAYNNYIDPELVTEIPLTLEERVASIFGKHNYG